MRIHPIIQIMAAYYLQSPLQAIPISTKVFLIGRAKNAQFEINHPSISKDHAYIQLRDSQRLFLKDMGSLNGTRVNGQRLGKHEEIQLHESDLIQFGQYEYKFRLVKKTKTQDREKKKQKRINLKDLFSPADSLDSPHPARQNVTKSKSKEKRINLTELKEPSIKNGDSRSQQSKSSNSISTRKPKQSKINMNNLDNFYRNREMEEFVRSAQVIPSSSNNPVQPPKSTTQAVQQHPKLGYTQELEVEMARLDQEMSQQKQFYQRRMQEERQKYRTQKQQLCKELQKLQFQRQEEQKRFKEQERQREKASLMQLQVKKKELDDKKRTIEIEAEAVGRENQKIYKQSIEKLRNSLSKHQQTERQLQARVNDQKQQLEQISSKFKQQSTTGQKLRSTLRQVQNKNKALLLYTHHLQDSVQKLEKMSKQSLSRGVTKQQSEIDVLRKLLHNRSEQISQLKILSKSLIAECSKENPRQSYQFEILLKNSQKIMEMKQQLLEYMDRQKHINQEWQEQIKLNNQESSKVKSILLKLNKNKEELEEIHATNTKKICQYHQQFYKFLQKQSNPQKKKAGHFLVNQLLQIQDERNEYESSIEALHLKIEEFIYFTLRERSETTRLSELLFSKTQSKFSQLALLHDKLQTLTSQVKELQSDQLIKSLQQIESQVYKLEIEIVKMGEEDKAINDKINNSFKHQETGKTALDFFSNLYSEKGQGEQQQAQEQKMLESHLQRLESQICLLDGECSTLTKRYQKFKANQLLEAQKLLNS